MPWARNTARKIDPTGRRVGAATLPSRKAVVVHSGARDAYQLALALAETGQLEALVTDVFWPSDRGWAVVAALKLPNRVRDLLDQRSESRVPSRLVRTPSLMGLATLLVDKLPRVSRAVKRRMMRRGDAVLGKMACREATRTGAAVVSYSYYAYDAFRKGRAPGILFQLHPHPASMRRILAEELRDHPDCAASLNQEWELSLPEEDFEHLVREPALASHILVASSFTKATLVENGTPAEKITVVPYGVDTARFYPLFGRQAVKRSRETLRLLFVGRINQRKGIKYLLEALRLLGRDDIHLTVCGRVVDGLELFRPFAGRVEVRPSVSTPELVRAYQTADLFVFPSVAEGFGQVLLEALASGLPILTTTRTAAPDLIEDGVQGFIVEPKRADLLAARIEWAGSHRNELDAMRVAARKRAEEFSWRRFRRLAAAKVSELLRQAEEAGERHV